MTNKVLNLRVKTASTLIEFLEYDQQKREMLVKFKRGKYKGRQRRYFDISNSAFMQILNAESVGKSFLKITKDKKGANYRQTIFSRLFA